MDFWVVGSGVRGSKPQAVTLEAYNAAISACERSQRWACCLVACLALKTPWSLVGNEGMRYPTESLKGYIQGDIGCLIPSFPSKNQPEELARQRQDR